jgi:hypothetical protein
MSQNWEVIFKPAHSVDAQLEAGGGKSFRVEFDPAGGGDVTVDEIGGGATRVRFYGTLRVKSIAGDADASSYVITDLGIPSKSA